MPSMPRINSGGDDDDDDVSTHDDDEYDEARELNDDTHAPEPIAHRARSRLAQKWLSSRDPVAIEGARAAQNVARWHRNEMCVYFALTVRLGRDVTSTEREEKSTHTAAEECAPRFLVM